jgi:(p)ppGpp synthase/HD superfamily hydrolase
VIIVMATLEDALVEATRAHLGQTRKGSGEPYILHPIRVMLSFSHESAVHRIVAIMHDMIEDTGWTMTELSEAWCGDPRVVEAVDAISRRDPGPPEAKETHRAYIDRVSENDIAVSVKLADLKDNMRDPWWCPRGMYERYTRDYQQLYAAAVERHLIIP